MDHRRTVLITGGLQGIGLGIAEKFAETGASLVIADADCRPAAEVSRHLKDKGADHVSIHSCDVSRRAEVKAVVDSATEEFGGIDVLINNAGICPFKEIMELAPETWQRTIDVNLTGAFHCTQLVAAKMIERNQGGRIIFITSLAENVTSSAQVDYGASKAGMKMLMAGFAVALGPHQITCNAIAPGMILTALTEHYWNQPEPARTIRERVPAGRIGTPRDIGSAALFLASPDAEYITGITLRVDGGHQVKCV